MATARQVLAASPERQGHRRVRLDRQLQRYAIKVQASIAAAGCSCPAAAREDEWRDNGGDCDMGDSDLSRRQGVQQKSYAPQR
ncbi:hypothetical protein FH972_022462 [Carpinus fangiana]|uniref:Uncharacterized protein n=1 Tax=Carpinus fangiana TaxID=176857 RepID=A0A5N6KSV8_9ROSI|nr:hypothetical protein FH972_022462 [Carpinus fangiana]